MILDVQIMYYLVDVRAYGGGESWEGEVERMGLRLAMGDMYHFILVWEIFHSVNNMRIWMKRKRRISCF